MNIQLNSRFTSPTQQKTIIQPTDQEIQSQLLKNFGEEACFYITKPDGSIDRSKLRSFLFSNELEKSSLLWGDP